MDQIRLTGIRAAGRHGVLDFEHERAQTFVVDATLSLDLSVAGRTDDLHDTVDYGAIAKGIVAIIEGEHVDLIEKLADRIATMILGYSAVARVQVTVHKPNAPIVVPFDDVSVTVERSRETVSRQSQSHAQDPDGASAGVRGEGRCHCAGHSADDEDFRNPADRADQGVVCGAGDDYAADTANVARPVHHVVIALGGNQGDVAATLRDAVRCIDGLPSTQVTGVSPLYRTDAWGMPAGTAEFLNAVVSVNTKLSAEELLRGLQRIEAEHGRVRTDHWTSRTLDLDIIDFDGMRSDDPDLTLPHPRAWQRAFVLGPWLALEPDAELGGAHAGSVAQLLHEASDRDHIDEISDDWMVGGTASRDTSSPGTADNATYGAMRGHAANAADGVNIDDARGVRDGARGADSEDARNAVADTTANTEASLPEGTAASRAIAAASAQSRPASRRAVISLDSPSIGAENQFRRAIAAIDNIPGNQVEGISPLYHVSQLDGLPDKMAAVIQIFTRMDARDVIASLGAIEESIGDGLDLDLVDMEGVHCDEPDCKVPWPTAHKRAAVLAPWLDMDPDAHLDGDPVSFLLAMAPDTAQVGFLTDNWIIGDTL